VKAFSKGTRREPGEMKRINWNDNVRAGRRGEAIRIMKAKKTNPEYSSKPALPTQGTPLSERGLEMRRPSEKSEGL